MRNNPNKNLIFLFFAVLIILPAIFPLFNNLFFRMHDYTHVARLHEMDEALRAGQFPVRWSSNLGWGYGMPLFNFYAPLPYYIAEFFHLIGFNLVNSIKITFGLSFFLAFLSMYLLAGRFFGRFGGFLSASAFVYAPYRAVDFYVRGALGELFSLSLLPFAILGILKLIKKKSVKNLVLSSITTALVMLSHTVLALLSIPVLIIVGLAGVLSAKKPKSIGLLFSSLIFGLGLSAFFWIPAFLEKQYTRVDSLTQGFSHYSHHFLYFRQFLYGNWGYGGSVDGINDLMSFHLGKGHLLFAGLSVVLSILLFKKSKSKKPSLAIWFSSLLIFTLAFLSTYHAKPIWDSLPLIAYIQFPWRLNSIIIILLSFIAGGSIYFVSRFLQVKSMVILLTLSVLFFIFVNYKYFKPEQYIDSESLYYSDSVKIKREMSSIIPDFIPKWVENDPEEIKSADYQILSGDAVIKTVKSESDEMILEIKSEDEFELSLNRFYFPGWKAYLDKEEIVPAFKDTNGVMHLSLPEGEYLVKIVFEKTKVRLLSEIISLASLAALLILLKKNEAKNI